MRTFAPSRSSSGESKKRCTDRRRGVEPGWQSFAQPSGQKLPLPKGPRPQAVSAEVGPVSSRVLSRDHGAGCHIMHIRRPRSERNSGCIPHASSAASEPSRRTARECGELQRVADTMPLAHPRGLGGHTACADHGRFTAQKRARDGPSYSTDTTRLPTSASARLGGRSSSVWRGVRGSREGHEKKCCGNAAPHAAAAALPRRCGGVALDGGEGRRGAARPVKVGGGKGAKEGRWNRSKRHATKARGCQPAPPWRLGGAGGRPGARGYPVEISAAGGENRPRCRWAARRVDGIAGTGRAPVPKGSRSGRGRSLCDRIHWPRPKRNPDTSQRERDDACGCVS